MHRVSFQVVLISLCTCGCVFSQHFSIKGHLFHINICWRSEGNVSTVVYAYISIEWAWRISSHSIRLHTHQVGLHFFQLSHAGTTLTGIIRLLVIAFTKGKIKNLTPQLDVSYLCQLVLFGEICIFWNSKTNLNVLRSHLLQECFILIPIMLGALGTAICSSSMKFLMQHQLAVAGECMKKFFQDTCTKFKKVTIISSSHINVSICLNTVRKFWKFS